MKSRLSSTIWTLVFANGIVLAAVIGLAYSAGRQSGGVSILDFAALPSASTGAVLAAVVLALVMIRVKKADLEGIDPMAAPTH